MLKVVYLCSQPPASYPEKFPVEVASAQSLEQIPSSTSNEIHALLRTDKALRVIEVPPAVVPAFVNIIWRSTATLGKVHSCRFALSQHKGVVNHYIRGADILRAMYAAINCLKALPRRERQYASASVFEC